MKKLLVISSAPVEIEKEQLRLDSKFVEGMSSYCAQWEGTVHCMLQKTGAGVPFGQNLHASDLPFEVKILDPGVVLGVKDLELYDVVLCSGDNHEYLHLSDICRGITPKFFYIIEYIFETRFQIVLLKDNLPIVRKIYAVLWALRHEIRRRRAFRKADGLQANGYPADAAYRRINSNTVLYLDNRITTAQLATQAEMAERRKNLMSGGQLRLIHSGRLERMKGSQDLVQIATHLNRKGIDFRLDIFGTGSLEAQIREDIEKADLQDRVHLHGVVDFQAELVPFARRNADIFLSCHRQSDPSCTYLESMGCGLAVAGYANRMWASLCKKSQAGWVSKLGDVEAMANSIASIAVSREDVAARCDAARAFAAEHTFEKEFQRRILQLSDC